MLLDCIWTVKMNISGNLMSKCSCNVHHNVFVHTACNGADNTDTIIDKHCLLRVEQLIITSLYNGCKKRPMYYSVDKWKWHNSCALWLIILLHSSYSVCFKWKSAKRGTKVWTLPASYYKSHSSEWATCVIFRCSFSILLTFCDRVVRFHLQGNVLEDPRHLNYPDSHKP